MDMSIEICSETFGNAKYNIFPELGLLALLKGNISSSTFFVVVKHKTVVLLVYIY